MPITIYGGGVPGSVLTPYRVRPHIGWIAPCPREWAGPRSQYTYCKYEVDNPLVKQIAAVVADSSDNNLGERSFMANDAAVDGRGHELIPRPVLSERKLASW